MTDDEVRRTIDDLERLLLADAIEEVEQHLAADDPELVHRVRQWYRVEVATAIAVFALLAIGAVLLTVGIATASWGGWFGGLGAFAGAFAVNAVRDRMARRLGVE
jgi:hypothetical protein